MKENLYQHEWNSIKHKREISFVKRWLLSVRSTQIRQFHTNLSLPHITSTPKNPKRYFLKRTVCELTALSGTDVFVWNCLLCVEVTDKNEKCQS